MVNTDTPCKKHNGRSASFRPINKFTIQKMTQSSGGLDLSFFYRSTNVHCLFSSSDSVHDLSIQQNAQLVDLQVDKVRLGHVKVGPVVLIRAHRARPIVAERKGGIVTNFLGDSVVRCFAGNRIEHDAQRFGLHLSVHASFVDLNVRSVQLSSSRCDHIGLGEKSAHRFEDRSTWLHRRTDKRRRRRIVDGRRTRTCAGQLDNFDLQFVDLYDHLGTLVDAVSKLEGTRQADNASPLVRSVVDGQFVGHIWTHELNSVRTAGIFLDGIANVVECVRLLVGAHRTSFDFHLGGRIQRNVTRFATYRSGWRATAAAAVRQLEQLNGNVRNAEDQVVGQFGLVVGVKMTFSTDNTQPRSAGRAHLLFNVIRCAEESEKAFALVTTLRWIAKRRWPNTYQCRRMSCAVGWPWSRKTTLFDARPGCWACFSVFWWCAWTCAPRRWRRLWSQCVAVLPPPPSPHAHRRHILRFVWRSCVCFRSFRIHPCRENFWPTGYWINESIDWLKTRKLDPNEMNLPTSVDKFGRATKWMSTERDGSVRPFLFEKAWPHKVAVSHQSTGKSRRGHTKDRSRVIKVAQSGFNLKSGRILGKFSQINWIESILGYNQIKLNVHSRVCVWQQILVNKFSSTNCSTKKQRNSMHTRITKKKDGQGDGGFSHDFLNTPNCPTIGGWLRCCDFFSSLRTSCARSHLMCLDDAWTMGKTAAGLGKRSHQERAFFRVFISIDWHPVDQVRRVPFFFSTEVSVTWLSVPSWLIRQTTSPSSCRLVQFLSIYLEFWNRIVKRCAEEEKSVESVSRFFNGVSFSLHMKEGAKQCK